jgi:isochorismate synthase EntC
MALFNLQEFLQEGSVITLRPGHLFVGWGPKKRFIDPLPSSFFLTDFFLRQSKPWFVHAQQQEMSVAELLETLGEAKAPPPLEWQNFYQAHFFKTVAHLQQLFQKQHLQKAVPYVFATVAQPMDPTRLVHTLHKGLSTSYGMIYGTWEEGQGLLGVTPELLFSQREGKLTSQALAGTGPKGHVQTPKNLWEHQLVINGIQEALSPFGHVRVGSTQEFDLPHLSHLSTPLEVEVQAPVPFKTLVHALHPTPALGAFPKPLGSKWLLNYNRTLPRFYYGAPMGFTHGGLDLAYVAIRNVQWGGSVMLLAAGCGVVPASSTAVEWEEIELKIDAIKRALGL